MSNTLELRGHTVIVTGASSGIGEATARDPAGSVADARTGPDFLSVRLLGLGAALAGALMVPTRTGRLDWNKL